MKYDLHSHFLPGIDDGAEKPADSVAILEYLARCGIECVCATPHYARRGESVRDFLQRRGEAVRRLDEYIDSSGIDRAALPRTVIGAEVHLFRGLSEREDLSELCYSGTDRILLELPFRKCEGWEVEEIYNIMYQHNVQPVMAHINRYRKFYSKKEFEDTFYTGDFFIQLNTECTLSHSDFSFFRKCVKDAERVVFGCDIHDPGKLADCGLERALKFFEKLPESRQKHLDHYERSVLRG